MLEIAGIEPNLLPPVVASNNIAGRVSTIAATALGVAKGTPVVTGAGDVACGLLGTGVTSDRRLLLTISTGGQITHPASNPEVDVIGRIHTFRSAIRLNDEGLSYLRLGAILSAGRSLSWLRDQILNEADSTTFSTLADSAETAPAGSDGLLFIPYIAGERTPHMNAEAKGMFLGMTIRHGRDHLIRAVMEGVALACYDAFSVLGEFGAGPELIVMAGGGARSLLWRQIVSDVFNLPVQSPVIWEQAALGAAMLAGSGIGIHDTNQAALAWPRYGSLIEPNLRRHERYQELMDIFRSAYHAIQHSSE
jgi:xylulokinase